jgi:hypothetical protein
MSLTFTKKISMSMGDKAFRVFQVTGDSSETLMSAESFDLHYIDFAMISPAVGDLSSGVYEDHAFLSADTATTIIGLGAAGTSGAIWNVTVWGW